MTLLHVRKTQVHMWKIPRCGGMNGVSVGTGCLRLSRVDRVNSRTSAHSVLPKLAIAQRMQANSSFAANANDIGPPVRARIADWERDLPVLPCCYRTQPNGAELAGRKRDKKIEKSRIYVLRVRLGLDENCLLFGVQTAVSLR